LKALKGRRVLKKQQYTWCSKYSTGCSEIQMEINVERMDDRLPTGAIQYRC